MVSTLKDSSDHKYQAGSLISTGDKAVHAASIRVQRQLSSRCDFAAVFTDCQGWGSPTPQ